MKKINRFWLGNVRKEIQRALENIKTQIKKEFPEDESRWLSKYEYKSKKIRFYKDGTICGGTIRLLFSLIDFSFLRNIFADCYSAEGGSAYDPVTMFLLELIKLWENTNYYTHFYETLRDPDKGRIYREYVGIIERIPDDVDMHNFRKRIGEESFQAVMSMLLELFKIVGVISGQILATDGTLIEAFANFRGCNYMDNCCKCMNCPSGLFQEINTSINETCALIDKEDKRSKIVSVEIQCPRPEAIELMKEALKNKKRKVNDSDIGKFSVLKIKVNRNPAKGWESNIKHLSYLTGIEVISSAVSLDENHQLKYCCPRACKDTEARTGYKRDRNNPNKYPFFR